MIYLDYAATTPQLPEVTAAMLPYFAGQFGNANSLHSAGKQAMIALEQARESLAESIGCNPADVVITSGGTESNNTAILGVGRAMDVRMPKGATKYIVTSPFEHPSISEPVKELVRHGWEQVIVPVNSNGFIQLEALDDILCESTRCLSLSKTPPLQDGLPRRASAPRNDVSILASIMTTQNEIGVTQDIPAIARIVHKHGGLLHTDAVQALGKLDLSPICKTADIVTLSAHKIGGPSGMGALIIKPTVPLEPLSKGGGQERGRRSGTQNVIGAVGFAKACELVSTNIADTQSTLALLEQYLVDQISQNSALNDKIRPILAVSSYYQAVNITHCGIVSFVVHNSDSKKLVSQLSERDIAVSTGSACGTKHDAPSPALVALGHSKTDSSNFVRISMSQTTTKDDLDELIKAITSIINR